MSSKGEEKQNEGKNGNGFEEAINARTIVVKGVVIGGIDSDRRTGSLRHLSAAGLNGSGVKDLHFDLSATAGIEIVEHKSIQSISIVIDSIVQVAIGSHSEESACGNLLELDYLVDLF